MPRNATALPRSRREGAALVMALLFAAVLGILMVALATTRIAELRSVSHNVQVTQAQLIAEAGVDAVMGAIRRDRGILPTTMPYYVIDRQFGEGRFRAEADLVVKDGTELIQIVSEGRDARDNRFTIEVVLDLELREANRTDVALLSCGNLELKGNIDVVGGVVYSGGNLLVQGDPAVRPLVVGNALVRRGEAIARGNVHFEGKGRVIGDVKSVTGNVTSEGSTEGQRVESVYQWNPQGQMLLASTEFVNRFHPLFNPPSDPPPPDYCGTSVSDYILTAADFLEYRALAELGGTHSGPLPFEINSSTMGPIPRVIVGDLIIKGEPSDPSFDPGGIYYVTGNLIVEGKFEWTNRPLTVIVEKTSTFRGQGKFIDPQSRHVFISHGDVSISGQAQIDGAVYSNGNIVGTGGNAVVNGSVMSMSTSKNAVSGNFGLNYRPTRDDWRIRRIEVFDIRRWRLVNNSN
jgi:hypothetical protein